MVGLVIREALGLYRRLFRPLVATSFLIFLPFTIALLALQLAVPDTTSTQQGLAIIDAVGSLLLFAPLASIVIIRCAITLEQTGAASPRRELGPAFGLLVSYVVTQLMVLLVIVALPGLLIAAGYAAGSPTIMTMGVGVLLGSALLNGVRLTVATVAVVTGDARNALALRRSAALTRGNWLRTLGVLVVVTLIALLVAISASSIGLAFPAGPAQDVGTSVFGLIGNALTVPIVALGSYRLYRVLEAQASARRAA
ncbi:MAG: hypothetical protein ACR2J9_12490 [Gaiellales bacterium]